MAKGIVFKTESIFTARFFTILNTRHNLRLPIVKVNAYKVCNKQEKIGGGKHFHIKIIHSQIVFLVTAFVTAFSAEAGINQQTGK